MGSTEVNNYKGSSGYSDAEVKAAGSLKQLEAREKNKSITVHDSGILTELRARAKAAIDAKAKKASKVVNIIKGIYTGIKKSVKSKTDIDKYKKNEK